MNGVANVKGGWIAAIAAAVGIGGGAGVYWLATRTHVSVAASPAPSYTPTRQAGQVPLAGGAPSSTGGYQRAAAAPQAAASQAPSVTGLRASLTASGPVLTWNGTQTTQYGGGSASGYNEYHDTSSGWKTIGVEVEPPLPVTGLPAGAVVGIAPTFRLPSGAEVAGAIRPVTLP